MNGGIAETVNWLVNGISRRAARTVPFRPFRLKLDAPLVSFSFDDFPLSAAENGARILEDIGARGTYYYAGGLSGRLENEQLIADAEMVADLARRGHEIGGHTHSHLNVHHTPTPLLKSDVALNEREIVALTGGRRPTSFAYPYGVVCLRSKLALMNCFAGLRGIQSGLNSGIIDLAHLKAQELYDATFDARSISALLDRLERQRGWLIFYTHDVRPDPTSIGCSPGLMAEVVDLVRRRGLQIDTVAGALDRIGAVKPTISSLKSKVLSIN